MANNDKHSELIGIERIARARKLSDIVHEICTTHGLKALADEIGSDESEISRFKNSQGGLTLPKMEEALLRRIEALERRVPPPNRPLPQEKKPINRPAFEKAFTAWMAGNNKPLYAYMKLYDVPDS